MGDCKSCNETYLRCTPVNPLLSFRGARVAVGSAVGQVQNGNRKPQSKAAEDSFEPMGSGYGGLPGINTNIAKSNFLT